MITSNIINPLTNRKQIYQISDANYNKLILLQADCDETTAGVQITFIYDCSAVAPSCKPHKLTMATSDLNVDILQNVIVKQIRLDHIPNGPFPKGLSNCLEEVLGT